MASRKQVGVPLLFGSAIIFILSALNSEPVEEKALDRNISLDLLNQLTIQEESRDGYQRELFMDRWSDFDQDGCDTRREILIQESLIPVIVEEDCKIILGKWVSIYDGLETEDPATFDVDHFVPLAEAWDSGANLWTEEKRELFANDLSDPDSLIAVSRESNRNKGDRDPANWLPILPDTHCWYVTTWVGIKHRWNLSVDQAEFAAIEKILNSC